VRRSAALPALVVAVLALTPVQASAASSIVDHGIATLVFVKAIQSDQSAKADGLVQWIEKSEDEDVPGARVKASTLIEDVKGCEVSRVNVLVGHDGVIWKCPGQSITIDRVYACRNDGCSKEVWATLFQSAGKLLVRYYFVGRQKGAAIMMPPKKGGSL